MLAGWGVTINPSPSPGIVDLLVVITLHATGQCVLEMHGSGTDRIFASRACVKAFSFSDKITLDKLELYLSTEDVGEAHCWIARAPDWLVHGAPLVHTPEVPWVHRLLQGEHHTAGKEEEEEGGERLAHLKKEKQ